MCYHVFPFDFLGTVIHFRAYLTCLHARSRKLNIQNYQVCAIQIIYEIKGKSSQNKDIEHTWNTVSSCCHESMLCSFSFFSKRCDKVRSTCVITQT